MAVVQGEFWTQVFGPGYTVTHYAAGTTTPKTVWTDGPMTNAGPQPMVCDGNGRIVLYGDGDYRFVIKDTNGSTVYDFDNVKLTAKAATLRGENQGISLPAATSANRGQLFATTDLTGNITALSIQKDSTFAPLFLVGSQLSGMVEFGKGADLSSANIVTLGSDGNYFDVIGTVGITGITAKPQGTVIWLRFTGVLTLTHAEGTFKLIGGQNYTTRANDVLEFLSLGNGNWEEVSRNGVYPVGAGGTGITSATLNGVLVGQGGNAPLAVTAAGAASRVFAVSSGGGAPAFQQVDQTMLTTNCVGTPQLRTATGATSIQASLVVAGSATATLDVTLNDYSFFPSLTASQNSGVVDPSTTGSGGWAAIDASDPGNTTGRVKISASIDVASLSPASWLTVLRWRYITASDNPDVWIAYDPDTGEIKGSWWSDDALGAGIVPIRMAGMIARRVTAADLEQAVSLPNGIVNAASARIRSQNLKPANLVFRSIQLHANDDAPAQWVLDNLKISGGHVVTK